MAFNNVPVNGWPQIKKLEELDAIAKKVDGMPVFSSTDRDWLDEWESKLPELPADPETDGVKVLTATTESGETTKSWEEPESGLVDYSTTEVNTGRKWIDGKDIYSIVIDFESNITLPNNTLYDTELDYSFVETLISAGGVYVSSDGTSFWGVNANIAASGHLRLQGCRLDNAASARYVYLEYTKVTVTTRKRGK